MTIGDRRTAGERSWMRPGLAAKRGPDVTPALVGLLALTPIIAVVMPAVWSSMGAPVRCRQHCVGQRGQIFTVFRLRAMRETFNR